MSNNRRRRFGRRRAGYGERIKPPSVVSNAVAIISGLSILIFGITIVFSSRMAGELPNWAGGAAVLFMLMALVCLALAVREFRNTGYDVVSRGVGLGISIVPGVLWGGVYILGILFG